ncbi:MULTISPECIES: tail completion protein gp17 [unclassified Ramlibacter]|uniref:tail completion protein gp17 n=1 Tax=unclassified Ramlibacter TaxID=2617605 RepID=UPI00363EB3B1
MESDLATLLQGICPRTYPDVAPSGTAAPYVTWQGLGGKAARFLDNSAADKRNTLLQVNAWASTRLEALTLIRQIEDALCASSAFVATPEGEPQSTYEEDAGLYGSVQRFSIWATR